LRRAAVHTKKKTADLSIDALISLQIKRGVGEIVRRREGERERDI
jgi:hypothetical protein